jgi:MFS family permease
VSVPSPFGGGLWRNRDFLTAWTGQSVSALGSQVSTLALPLTAVVVLGAGPAEMGLLGAAQFAPALLLGLIAGVWVDRLPRRPILIAADVGRAALIAAVPLLALLGLLRIEHMVVIAFLVGSLSVLFDLAAHAYLPALVGREHVLEANSKFEQSASLAGVAGPSLAGLLVAVVSAPVAVVIDAVSFAASALCLARIRAPEAPPARASGQARIWSEIGEGVRTVAANPVLRAIMASGAVVNLSGSLIAATYVLYVTRELGVGPAALGLILASSGLGSLAAAFVARSLADRLGVGPGLLVGAAAVALGRLLHPAAGLAPDLAVPILLAGQALTGGAFTLLNVTSVSMRQTSTPDHLRGRVGACARVVMAGGRPLGALLGGALGLWLGLGPALLVAAGLSMLAVLPLLLSPIPTLGRPEAVPQPV